MEPQLRPELRIDKLLWYLRLTHSRARAQAIIAAGHVRLNDRRVERDSACVREGDVIALPLTDMVCVIRVRSLPTRRGPSAEARGCYEEL